MAQLKPVEWIGSSRDDLRSFPGEVREVMGEAIYRAQKGAEHPAAKALKGFGGRGVLEIVDDYRGDTYRAIYTVRFATVIYVLHAFQKKFKKGIATPRQEIEVIKLRLRRAEDHYQSRYRKTQMTDKIQVHSGKGNVFADLGFDNPEEMQLRADLVQQLREVIGRRGLTQVATAKLLGIRQPDLSALLHGRLTKYSLGRLLTFMTILGRDVEIVLKTKPRQRSGRMTLAVG